MVKWQKTQHKMKKSGGIFIGSIIALCTICITSELHFLFHASLPIIIYFCLLGFSEQGKWQRQIYQQAELWCLNYNRVKSLSVSYYNIFRTCEGGTGWIFLYLWVSSWLSPFSDSHRKRIVDWYHNFCSSLKIKWKRKASGRRERWTSKEAMLLFCSQLDDKPVS